MMNVASPQTAAHFAPPARQLSTRRQQYNQPVSSQGQVNRTPFTSPRQSTQEFVQPSYSAQPQHQHQQHLSTSSSYLQASSSQRSSLQRNPTSGSSNSLGQYASPASSTGGRPTYATHRRQTESTSTSNSSINRVPSGNSQYYTGNSSSMQLTAPLNLSRAPSTLGGVGAQDTYVARLRRAKGTVWSARGQREDLDRSNSNDKRNQKYNKKLPSSRTKLTSSGGYTYESSLPAHPRQLLPRLSANEAEDSDYNIPTLSPSQDPFLSGPHTFTTETTTLKTIATTSSTSPHPSGSPPASAAGATEEVEDGRGSPDPIQNWYKPVQRGESKRVSRATDDGAERQVGGERKLFVVNASPDESEGE